MSKVCKRSSLKLICQLKLIFKLSAERSTGIKVSSFSLKILRFLQIAFGTQMILVEKRIFDAYLKLSEGYKSCVGIVLFRD